VAGDLFFLLESKKYTYKPWVDDLSVPYVTFFVVAAGASTATVVSKIVLSVQKSRSRGRASARAVMPAIALADTADEERLAKLDEEIEANRLDQRKAYVASNANWVQFNRLLASPRRVLGIIGSIRRIRALIALYRCCELLLLVCEDIPMGMQPQPLGSVAMPVSPSLYCGAIFFDRCDERLLLRPFYP
jgi:hypothetical protein